MKIQNNREQHTALIEKVEIHYKAEFIGVFEHNDKIVLAFYNKTPNKEKGHTEYFIIYNQNGAICIANGDWLKTIEFNGIKLPSGDIIYSSHRHHYNEQEGYFIDGGFSYTRTNQKDMVLLGIKEGKIVQLDNLAVSNTAT